MGEVKLNCPYCVSHGKLPDTRGHLYLNTDKNLFHCKRCGHKGVWDRDLPPPVQTVNTSKYEGVEVFTFRLPGYSEQLVEYACSRLPLSIVNSRTGWSPDMPMRWFFPIWSKGRAVVWQARAIENVNPKYITYGKKSSYVYNFEHVRDFAVVFEGPINALSCPHGVAIFGKSLSKDQENLLVSKYNKLYLALDYGTDEDRQRIHKQIGGKIEVVDVMFEDERDANDLGVEVMVDKLRKVGAKL